MRVNQCGFVGFQSGVDERDVGEEEGETMERNKKFWFRKVLHGQAQMAHW